MGEERWEGGLMEGRVKLERGEAELGAESSMLSLLSSRDEWSALIIDASLHWQRLPRPLATSHTQLRPSSHHTSSAQCDRQWQRRSDDGLSSSFVLCVVQQLGAADSIQHCEIGSRLT